MLSYLPFWDSVGYNPLLPRFGSPNIVVLGYNSNSIASIIFFTTLNEPSRPFWVTTLKLSLCVWYSGYSDLDLEKQHTGKSIPGAQYCLSSLPRSK